MRVRVATSRPLGGAIKIAGHSLDRRAVLLSLTDGEGCTGYGELCPLPGTSPDTLPEALRSLAPLVAHSQELTEREFYPLRQELLANTRLSASAHFAVESALLDLLGQRSHKPGHEILAHHLGYAVAPAPLNALLPADGSGAQHAGPLRELGFSTFKIKVSDTHATTLRALEQIRRAAPECALRLDANRRLSPNRITEDLEKLAEFAPVFIEEPVAPAHLPTHSPIALALDETLSEAHWQSVLAQRREVSTLVIKPQVVGGLCAALTLAARARAHKLDVVVTHLFDGPVGLAAASELALATATSACGLAPHAALTQWPSCPAPQLAPASLVKHSLPGLGLQAAKVGSW